MMQRKFLPSLIIMVHQVPARQLSKIIDSLKLGVKHPVAAEGEFGIVGI
jgi:hypothetical protein